jgi:hypothetical protein
MPLVIPPPQTFLQSVWNEISADTTTTSTTLVDLISVSITTGANQLLIWFSASLSMSVSGSGYRVRFSLQLDGAVIRGFIINPLGGSIPYCVPYVYKKTGITAAAHTVKIQWCVVGSTTARIRPVTTILEHCSLMVAEVTQ